MEFGRSFVVDDLRSAELRPGHAVVYDREIEVRTLYEDPASGIEHMLIRYPAGMTTRPHRHSAGHAIVVLEGRMRVNDAVIGPGGYCHFPAGEVMVHEPADGGPCLFVVLFDGRVDVEPVDGHEAEGG
jgi:quercetin dioxygenase-like cupin family protein